MKYLSSILFSITSFTLLFIFVFVTTTEAQDWESQNGNSTVSALNEVQFVSNQTLFAVGNTGTILKSTDGGQNWNDVSYGTTKDIQTLFFFDENNGFVGTPFMSAGGGSSEMLAKTTDGGESWEVFSSFSFDDFNDLEFLDDQMGWAASVDGKILFTTDGGETWSSTSPGSDDLQDIEIVNDTTLWVSGEYGTLLKSTDSGENWEKAVGLDTISTGEFSYLSSSDDILDVEFIDEQTGYIIGETYDSGFIGFLLKTEDGGENWVKLTNDVQHQFFDLEITDDSTIVIAAGQDQFIEAGGNAILISDDDGASWNILQDGNGPIAWHDIDRHQDSWIAVGESGSSVTFSLSDDTLQTNLITGQNIQDLTFWGENNGVFVTSERIEGKIFTTNDGGQTWSESLSLDGNKDFAAVSYAAENDIWVAGNDLYTGDSRWLLYHTSDAGQNWEQVEPDFSLSVKSRNLEDVFFINTETGFIKVETTLIKTEDGGANWMELTEPEDHSFSSFDHIRFLDEEFGWMSGSDVIAITTDGGNSWEIIYEQDSQSPEISKVQFLDSSLGYVTMERGDMMKTTDGGESWNDLSTFVNFDLNDLHFTSADTGFAVGDGGRILITADGGENFTSSYNITSKDLISIHMIDENIGWISGEKGTLLSTSTGGGIATSNVNEEAINIPVSAELHQNYPNPFNPTTVISYQLSENSKVQLEVFDMLGRKVATLVNGNRQTAGEHKITFNASNLSSGVYLYQLKTGNTVITKKLTLIK